MWKSIYTYIYIYIYIYKVMLVQDDNALNYEAEKTLSERGISN